METIFNTNSSIIVITEPFDIKSKPFLSSFYQSYPALNDHYFNLSSSFLSIFHYFSNEYASTQSSFRMMRFFSLLPRSFIRKRSRLVIIIAVADKKLGQSSNLLFCMTDSLVSFPFCKSLLIYASLVFILLHCTAEIDPWATVDNLGQAIRLQAASCLDQHVAMSPPPSISVLPLAHQPHLHC